MGQGLGFRGFPITLLGGCLLLLTIGDRNSLGGFLGLVIWVPLSMI